MDIKTNAVAGTLESGDVYVRAEPCDKLNIEIESVVYDRFAEDIRKSVTEVLKKMGVPSGKITLRDRGALDCVIRARVETAVKRAGGEKR